MTLRSPRRPARETEMAFAFGGCDTAGAAIFALNRAPVRIGARGLGLGKLEEAEPIE
jgi:hypothetical protein